MQWEWIAKINNPVTLTAFALALVFWAMSRVKGYRWWPVAAMCLAALTVIGGLTLAYRDDVHPAPPPPIANTPIPEPTPTYHVQTRPTTEPPRIEQHIETHGAGSPVINGGNIKGDIIIRTNQ